MWVILFSVIYIEYMKSQLEYKYIDFDFQYLSTSDYSIEFRIHETMWHNFTKTY